MSSENQFLVVEKIEQCRWTVLGNQREGGIPPGNLIVVRPCNDGINNFEVHRGSAFLSDSPGGSILVTREGGLPRDKVISITGQEFDMLLTADTSYEAGLELGKCKSWTGPWTGLWTDLWTGLWTVSSFDDDHFLPCLSRK